MKIRSQLIGSIVFFGIALLIITASVISSNQHIDQVGRQEDLVKNVELKTNELGYLTNDYLLYRESPQLDRWELKYTSLSDDLANLTVDAADQQVLVNSIRESQKRLKAVFKEIVASAGNASGGQQDAVDPTFLQVSSSRIGVQTQGMVFDASRLGQKLRDEQDRLKLANYVQIIALLGVFGLFILTSYFLVYRRTLKSISDLQASTQIIGSGNLDHVIVEKTNDEFGELSRAVNRMTTQLKTVTASKVDLEKEVTERKRAEEELLIAKQQAELYLDLMGHDISNMHQIIMGQLELAQEVMEQDGRLEGNDREMIDTSARTLRRSAKLIENIRNIQKLKTGEFKIERMDLGDVLGEVVEGYSKLPDRDISISYAPIRGYNVNANPLIKDIFINLLDNTVKHCDDPVRISVDISSAGQNGSTLYRVIVEDNGRGVPDDKKAVIFNRLSRGETKARGTGLGLYIVKTLVEGFGGSVSVEDRVPGDHSKGARFVVMLPAVET
jgi:signal transduction histidine kinase